MEKNGVKKNMSKNNLFEDHPLVKGLGTILVIDSILYFLGFKEEQQLAIVTFIIVLIVMVIYFDNEIQKVNERLKSLEQNNGETMKLNQKGMTQMGWFIIIILILLLLYYLFQSKITL